MIKAKNLNKFYEFILNLISVTFREFAKIRPPCRSNARELQLAANLLNLVL